MLTRNDIKEYAKKICIPFMERNLRRTENGDWSYKPDQVGYVPAYLENFCRPFWGIAPILASGEALYLKHDGREISALEYMREVLRKGFTKGTCASWENSREFMGGYSYENQNITELAGLMVGIFFAKEQLWEPLPKEEKDWFAKEIYEMAEVAFDHSWPNNHYWFPLFSFTVLKRLGYQFDRTDEMLEKGLDFLDSLYLGDGWYQDGAFGRFDYYEAWSLHMYPLLWTLLADSSFAKYEERKKRYVERTNIFLKYYIHWFDANGANVAFGRSLSYRFAACSIFPVAVLAGCDINPSLAGRITAKNIEFFKEHVKTEETDILPEGYLYHAPAVVEGYTSDGGAYWCCKAFLALLIEEGHPFWDYDKAVMPSEEGDYLAESGRENIHMLFEGHDGLVTLYNNTANYCTDGVMTHAFGNIREWYSKFVYHSAVGFGCSGVDNLAIDSMISLVTEGRTMHSHRFGFKDLGYQDGVLLSEHTPFENDPQTKIKTWIIPCGAYHVRIHKVYLANRYMVWEGGFSVSRWDDYCPVKVDGNVVTVENHAYRSVMKTVSDVETELRTGSVQANHHLYAPLAAYPEYATKVLAPGVYTFASAFAVTRVSDEVRTLPELTIMDDCVEICQEGRKKVIRLSCMDKEEL